MARNLAHRCAECGFESLQWHGQCPGCEAWNTLIEERLPSARASARARARPAGRGAVGSVAGTRAGASIRLVPPRLGDVGATPLARLSTGIGEFDRVLGGG